MPGETMCALSKRLVWISLAVLLIPVAAWAAERADKKADASLVRVEKVDVVVSQVGPVVMLQARNRAIPVFVDIVVAESIQAAQRGAKLARPLTHDLMRSVLEGFDGKVTQVVVTLKERTFYGALTVSLGKTTKVFDSRSSDAIALAIHFKAPILVSPELLEASGIDMEQPKDGRML
jgi:bifunctional DNase/RNase